MSKSLTEKVKSYIEIRTSYLEPCKPESIHRSICDNEPGFQSALREHVINTIECMSSSQEEILCCIQILAVYGVKEDLKFFNKIAGDDSLPEDIAKEVKNASEYLMFATVFEDSYSPTDSELEAWAYLPKAWVPDQDWELQIATIDRIPLFVKLASDEQCRAQKYFLNCLYFVVGCAVGGYYFLDSKGEEKDIELIQAYLDQLESGNSNTKCISKWIDDSRQLIQDPATFSYYAWCDGGIAYNRIDGNKST